MNTRSSAARCRVIWITGDGAPFLGLVAGTSVRQRYLPRLGRLGPGEIGRRHQRMFPARFLRQGGTSDFGIFRLVPRDSMNK
jgi:hypothetical protein